MQAQESKRWYSVFSKNGRGFLLLRSPASHAHIMQSTCEIWSCVVILGRHRVDMQVQGAVPDCNVIFYYPWVVYHSGVSLP